MTLTPRRGRRKRKRKLKLNVVDLAFEPFVWVGMAVEWVFLVLTFVFFRAACAAGWHLWSWEPYLRVSCYEPGAWRCLWCDAVKVCPDGRRRS